MENENEKDYIHPVYPRFFAANAVCRRRTAVPAELEVYRRPPDTKVVHRRQIRCFRLLGLVFGSGMDSEG